MRLFMIIDLYVGYKEACCYGVEKVENSTIIVMESEVWYFIRNQQIDTWTIGVRTEKKTAYHLLIAALFSGLHTDFYRLNKIASLQTIQYGVSIDFLLLDFTKESMHWKLIPSYIQNSNLSYRMKVHLISLLSGGCFSVFKFLHSSQHIASSKR